MPNPSTALVQPQLATLEKNFREDLDGETSALMDRGIGVIREQLELPE